MIAELERLIKGASFGDDGPYHRVTIGLTEAEAAAVYASKQQFEVGYSQFALSFPSANIFQKDDVILICDSGGGTTV